MACILLWSSAVRVHDSQAYRKMDVTREPIICILELREILLSFQTGFNLVNAAVVCAILESISGLEPSSVITEPRYLKLVTVSSFCEQFTGTSPRRYHHLGGWGRDHKSGSIWVLKTFNREQHSRGSPDIAGWGGKGRRDRDLLGVGGEVGGALNVCDWFTPFLALFTETLWCQTQEHANKARKLCYIAKVISFCRTCQLLITE